jgi:hypothetical protein
MLELIARKVLGLLNGNAEPGLPTDVSSTQLVTDLFRALWVRDYMSQPAQQWVVITPGSPGTLPAGIRSIRVDIAAGGTGTATFTFAGALGSATLNVAAGEILSITSTAATACTGASSGVTLYGLL